MMNKLHEFLIKFRVLQVQTTLFLQCVLWVLVEWMMQTPYEQLTEWQVAPYAVALPALITGLFASLKSAIKPAEETK